MTWDRGEGRGAGGRGASGDGAPREGAEGTKKSGSRPEVTPHSCEPRGELYIVLTSAIGSGRQEFTKRTGRLTT